MSDVIGSAGNVNLGEFLAAHARQASDGRLALAAAVGLIILAALPLSRPPGSIALAGAGLCFFAFGIWGIVDRELSERLQRIGPLGGGALRAARMVAALLGTLGGLSLIYGALALTLGTWIS